MQMKTNKFFLLTSVITLVLMFGLAACGPKIPKEVAQAKAAAEAAIAAAQQAIKEVTDLGGEAIEAKELLSEARDAYGQADYILAKDKADAARKSAEAERDALLQARAEAERLAGEKLKTEEHLGVYTVGTWERDRDCLWNISGKDYIYNDPWKWKRIYKANDDKIKNPDLIYPGQVLDIP